MKILLIAALILTPTLAQAKNTGCDGYQVTRTDLFQTDIAVSFKLYPSRKEFMAAAAKLSPPKAGHGELTEFVSVGKDRCTVHIVDPRKSYDPCFLGHAISHCMLRNYHNE